jgi:hypothetical protein
MQKMMIRLAPLDSSSQIRAIKMMRQFSTSAVVSGNLNNFRYLTSNKGHVKVEYAFETARVRLYLPSKGETWFFIDSQTTVQGFKDQIKKEDSLIENFDLLDGDRKQIKSNKEDSLYSVISGQDSAEIYVKINNHLHSVDSAKANDLSFHVEDFKWFKKCASSGLASAHSATISTFLN